jgi:diguanylate cyclase (GGDEF)-like protein
MLAASAVIVVSQLGALLQTASSTPMFWLMTALAVLATTQAVTMNGPGGTARISSSSICFTFAVLLCWGLGPALLAHLAGGLTLALRIRLRPAEYAFMTGQHVLAYAAASLVLTIGQPDPFERDGPTNAVADALIVLGSVGAWLVTYGVLLSVSAFLLRNDRLGLRGAIGEAGDQIIFKAGLLLLSPVLAVAAHVNVAFVLLVFGPLFAMQRMARLSAERAHAVRLDALTGLANRVGLRDSFDDIANDPRRWRGEHDPRQLALLMLDLDRFKHVNDALGHEVGDRLLVAAARRLQAAKPAGGVVARLGGDEFAILARTRSRAEAQSLADQVSIMLSEPVALDGLRLDLTASIGVAVRLDGEDFATLLRHADVAMYQAKERRDAVAFYEPHPDHNSPERLGLLTDFRTALETGDRDQLMVHYQPQIALDTGRVVAVEALLRWRHPTHGSVNPQDVLRIAEHTPVMHLLTAWIINEVTADLARWSRDGITVRASINVSVRDLYGEDIAEHLSARLLYHGIRPERIQLEVTESALMVDPNRAQITLAGIAEIGVPIALDDFGTGYSSLLHLRRLPVTELKIDRSFVAGMARSADDAAIVRSTIQMARSLGLRTVAEGVEDEQTRQMLADAGCTLSQGWLDARPMPGRDIPQWLARRDLARVDRARTMQPAVAATHASGATGGNGDRATPLHRPAVSGPTR